MKKIPTLFERDWNGDRSRVTEQVHPGCEWVLADEGVATRKLDGTCCMIRDGVLYKRRELRLGDTEPTGFEISGHDEETHKTVGWVPVGDGPEDKYHREMSVDRRSDGTFELIGPKIQGNPEKWSHHDLMRHGSIILDNAPRTFHGLRGYLEIADIEGIVFHHPDGRMAKIKTRDFGLKRGKP